MIWSRVIVTVGERIVNGHELAGLVPRIGEIALPFERSRHPSRTDQSLYPAQALIRKEEESSVLAVVEMRDDNRSAPGAAELVEAVGRLTQSAQVHEEILGAEFVVAEKFEQAAVQLVRSGLADQINHASSRVGKFCAEVVGLHLVFVHHIHRWKDGRTIERGLRVRSAIESEHVLIGPGAVDGDELIVVHPISHLAEAQRGANAWYQGCEAKTVAAVQGEIYDTFVLDDMTERGTFRFERWRLPCNGHRFGRQSEFERDIHGKSQRDVQLDVVMHEALESCRLRL